MTGYSRLLVSAVCASLLIVGCATNGAPDLTVGADQPTADFVLRLDGGGRWKVSCEGRTSRGDAKTEERGRRTEKAGVIALSDVASMRCSYTSGTAPLLMSLEETGMACPFGDFEQGLCRTQFEAGAQGVFEFSPVTPG